MLRFVATVQRGLADLLAEELRALGAADARERGGGVGFTGTLEAGYRACLESRLASRVLLEVHAGPLIATPTDSNGLYDLVRAVPWREHIDTGATIACEFTGQHAAIANSHYAALRVKDAICDQLRETSGWRPDVATQRPSLRVHVHAARGQGSVLIDLAGEALSRRGYRIAGGEAPLRETLAAGILLRAQWPRIAAAGGEFLDPMCGSGTLAIEAAWMAAGIAPGLMRDYFGFLGWRQHDAALWERVREAALSRAAQALPVVVRGTDRSSAAIATARANARRAGVGRDVRFDVIDLAQVRPDSATGLLCVNPPYGERIGQGGDAEGAHTAIGVALRERFADWDAAVLTGEPTLGQLIGVEATRVHTVFNGAIECRLLRFAAGARRARRKATGVVLDDAQALAATPGARMFANRLQKNLQHLGKLARRQDVGCYRLYDTDMPEYALAIDRYAGAGEEEGQQWLFVQEYAPPATVDPDAAQRRRQEALAVLPEVTGVPLPQIHLRVRRRQKGTNQYERANRQGAPHVVSEAGLKFLVNFEEYLDTGLFLDHRDTRARIRAAADGKHFLNLFCYTASATVHAAAGGARRTVSVDLSRTYLDWARRNLELNGFGADEHLLVQADCLRWLDEAAAGGARYDLIFLDPPTFSNSARMDATLDVQRDHAGLLSGAMRLLDRDGLLIFSTNAQRFALDEALGERLDIRDISAATLPFDYQRNPKIHRCFEIRHR